MINIAVKGVNDVIKEFEKDAIRMRSAARTALNQTAYHAAQDQKKTATKQLDEPTPFTLRGFKYQKATIRNLRAAVYVDRIQAEYLQWQVYGGTRMGAGSSGNESVPVSIKLNKYGNIPGRRTGKIKKLINRKDTFIGTIKGVYGLWQRGHISKSGKFSVARKSRSTNIRLLVAFVPYVHYKKRLQFFETANKSFYKRFDRELDRALMGDRG